jgi:hypothetical protein
MNDSSERDRLETKHERIRERRIEAVKRWVEYIASEPPETWGPQQNAVVNGQLEAAQSAETSASHRQYVDEMTEEILNGRDGSGENSK